MLYKGNLDCVAQWNKRWNCVRTFVDQKLTWTNAVWYKLVYVRGNKMPTRCNKVFYCRSYCLLNMFRAPLRPSSGAQEYYTVVAAFGISCCGFQVAGLVWSWGIMCPVCRMLLHPANRTNNPSAPHYAHHQELKSIIQWLLHVVFRAVVFK